MDSIERRLAKLEAMARPQAAARFHVLLAGEPQPEDVGEGDWVVTVTSENSRRLTLRLLAGEGTE